ncbi:MAG: hypothetical protein Q9220_003980 [cf. Caloplaca sp. 1 TL-2023]
MQKLLKRTAQVHRQVARRKRAVRSKNDSDTRKLLRQQQGFYAQNRRDVLVSARNAYKEDWLLGPLAPRRDVGDKAETHGTVPLRMVERVEKMDGKWKKWGIVEGDRVCIVGKGERDKGKIGVISVATLEYMKQPDQPSNPTQTTEAPIPLSSVRLVIPLSDPSTGIKRDVMVNEITLTATNQRYIANYMSAVSGKPYSIPWPPEPAPQSYEDHDDDTLRIDVESETWVPTLLRSPMPSGVIDELRNKYSKFRTRHEDSYVEMKKGIDAAQGRRQRELAWGGGTTREMLTPVQELNRARRAERKGMDREGLTESVLAGIGEIMARRGRMLPEEKKGKRRKEGVDVPPPESRSTEAQAA